MFLPERGKKPWFARALSIGQGPRPEGLALRTLESEGFLLAALTVVRTGTLEIIFGSGAWRRRRPGVRARDREGGQRDEDVGAHGSEDWGWDWMGRVRSRNRKRASSTGFISLFIMTIDTGHLVVGMQRGLGPTSPGRPAQRHIPQS